MYHAKTHYLALVFGGMLTLLGAVGCNEDHLALPRGECRHVKIVEVAEVNEPTRFSARMAYDQNNLMVLFDGKDNKIHVAGYSHDSTLVTPPRTLIDGSLNDTLYYGAPRFVYVGSASINGVSSFTFVYNAGGQLLDGPNDGQVDKFYNGGLMGVANTPLLPSNNKGFQTYRIEPDGSPTFLKQYPDMKSSAFVDDAIKFDASSVVMYSWFDVPSKTHKADLVELPFNGGARIHSTISAEAPIDPALQHNFPTYRARLFPNRVGGQDIAAWYTMTYDRTRPTMLHGFSLGAPVVSDIPIYPGTLDDLIPWIDSGWVGVDNTTDRPNGKLTLRFYMDNGMEMSGNSVEIDTPGAGTHRPPQVIAFDRSRFAILYVVSGTAKVAFVDLNSCK